MGNAELLIKCSLFFLPILANVEVHEPDSAL